LIIRQFTEHDLDWIKKVHKESGFDYELPTFSGENFFSRRVVADHQAEGMASFMKLTAEAYLICDPTWRNSAWRYEALRQLQTICNKDAQYYGVKEVHCFIPPEIEKTFGRRLKRMGWSFYMDKEWKCFSREVT
jgi:hypothetical protein